MPTSLEQYREEVESGLPNERRDMDQAAERQAFFDYEGFRYEKHFRRDAESSFDFQGRSHRPSGFLRECIEVLCEHLYCPGPARRWSESAGDELLQRVYTDNLINSLMLEADTLSTLNEVTAIQIDAGLGDFALKPITYRLWGKEQFAVWTDPDSAATPIAVCTKDTYDLQTRYRLWSDAEVWTFTTERLQTGLAGGTFPTAGGRVAYLRSKEDHDYGCLPFTFVHYTLPIRSFDVTCIGEYLWKAEITIDDRLSILDESIKKYLNPIPVAEGVPADWKPNVEPGRFIRLPRAGPILTPAGGYEPGEFARLYYLTATIDVTSAWDDLLKYINQALEASRVPASAVRMQEQGVASGIALIVEQEPLLKRAERRRATFAVYEQDLACRTLLAAGNHYGMPGLVTAAESGKLITAWPTARLAINTPDKLELGIGEVQAGLKSHLMLLQDWYGIGREEAIELAKQIKADQDELASVNPDMAAVGATPNPEEDHQKRMELAQARNENKGENNGEET
jgi:hypothetical protein